MDMLWKKILILYSEKNKFVWKKAKTPGSTILEDIRKDDCISALGVSKWTMSKWIGQTCSFSPKSQQKIADHLNQRIIKEKRTWPVRAIDLSHFDDSYPLHEFAQLFDMSREQCNKIVDEQIFARRPLMPSFYFPKIQADTLLESIGGFYTFYRREYSTKPLEKSDFVSFGIHVRSVLSPKDMDSVLRAKIVFKLLEGSEAPYDGYIGIIGDQLYWAFETRQQKHDPDGIFMLTDKGDKSTGNLVIRGQYMSVDHGRGRTPTTWRVFGQCNVRGSKIGKEQADGLFTSAARRNAFGDLPKDIAEEFIAIAGMPLGGSGP